MEKNCTFCGDPFSTGDKRQKTCSETCANRSRSELARKQASRQRTSDKKCVTAEIVPTQVKSVYQLLHDRLPPPEELPAPYAKRVHDMWVALTEGAPTRIA